MQGGRSVLKAWHFVASQVILFIAVLTFMGSFGAWAFTEMKDSFYPNTKGLQLESSIGQLNSNIEKQNAILIDLRLYIARNVRAVEKLNAETN